MNLTKMIVLANSWKHGDWCLAGIDVSTDKWVRPVTTLNDGRVRKSDMKLQGYFPKLLDVIEVPLDDSGPDFGFESENRTILPGPWRHAGAVDVNRLLKYVVKSRLPLHNTYKYVKPSALKVMPLPQRRTLQLIRVDTFAASGSAKSGNAGTRWTGTVVEKGRTLELPITDPVFVAKLEEGHRPKAPCLLTLSLGMPYRPSEWDSNEEPVCWKLIAGVMELET